MRDLCSGQSRLKDTLLELSVARYMRTGMATIPKLITPFQIERGMLASPAAACLCVLARGYAARIVTAPVKRCMGRFSKVWDSVRANWSGILSVTARGKVTDGRAQACPGAGPGRGGKTHDPRGGAGITSTRRRRAPTYRSRRERRSAAGMLVQLDASRHRWFGGDGPYASPHGAIDDATGEVLAAVFREEEDAAGYFTLLGQILAARGVPLAAYSDRHGVFWRSARERESIEEELLGRRQPTQLGRAFAECETQLILANSPQAKGRVERLFGTFQDRLVSELRLAGITDLE